LFSSDVFRKTAILLVLIALNLLFAFLKSMIPIIKRYFYGLELVLVCTVASSMALGPKIGMTMGILLMVVNYIGERRPSDYFAVTITLYSMIGYVSYYFRSYGIVPLGISIAIIYNLIAFMFSKLLGAKVSSLVFFAIINILFNIMIFSLYGNSILDMLS
jgi:hypothetical protein